MSKPIEIGCMVMVVRGACCVVNLGTVYRVGEVSFSDEPCQVCGTVKNELCAFDDGPVYADQIGYQLICLKRIDDLPPETVDETTEREAGHV